jgi:hypothetical protein
MCIILHLSPPSVQNPAPLPTICAKIGRATPSHLIYEPKKGISGIMPSALPVNWEEVRKAYEGGLDDEIVASRFGVNRSTLRARKRRENWISPAKLEQAAIIARATAKARSINNSSVQRATDATAPSGIDVLGENIAEYGRKGNLAAVKLLHSLLTNAKIDDLEPLSDANSVVTTLKGLRLGTGMDKAEGSVNLALSMFSSPNQLQDASADWIDA